MGWKTIISLTGTFLVVMMITGCQEQNLQDSKKGRLLATENAQLTELLEKCAAELENQKKLLVNCQEEKNQAAIKTQKATKEMMDFVMERNKEMANENKKLLEKIATLEKSPE